MKLYGMIELDPEKFRYRYEEFVLSEAAKKENYGMARKNFISRENVKMVIVAHSLPDIALLTNKKVTALKTGVTEMKCDQINELLELQLNA